MIILIYGVQRSGKTTLISKLLKRYGNKAVHIKRSKIMNDLANNMYNKVDDGSLSDEELKPLYKLSEEVIDDYNRKYKLVLMDCHAGYLKSKELYDFRPESYHKLGDLYFYMKTNPNVIKERMIETNGLKDTYNFNVDEISLYQNLELQRLKSICASINKKVSIIGEDLNSYEEIIKILDFLV